MFEDEASNRQRSSVYDKLFDRGPRIKMPAVLPTANKLQQKSATLNLQTHKICELQVKFWIW